MKKLNFIICFVISVFSAYAQGEPPSVGLKNIAPPNSPAFVLMDITPSSIVIPENIQAFSIQTLSAFSGNSNNGLSNNNYAVEFQPYWYVERKDMNFFKYNNLTTSKPKGAILSIDDYTGYNAFGDIGKKASVSLALMNGTFEVFETPQSYISIGARTRLISFRTEKQINDFKAQYKKYEQLMGSVAVVSILGNAGLTDEEKNTQITSLQAYKSIGDDFENIIQRKPLFALDVALAYSHFLGDENQDYDDGFGRFGFWVSGDLALYTPTICKESYLHFYGVFRYLRDGLNIDTNTSELFTESKIDYGGKIEFEFSKISFAYEYITRDSDNNNESRSVGSIRYKINNAFTLNGGFGENFMSEGNSIALFGIQWGLDKSSTVKLSPN